MSNIPSVNSCNHVVNEFDAAGTCLPSRCLATIGGDTHTRPPAPSSRKRGDPISKHVKVLGRTKIWPWVRQDPKPRLTVLARTNSNLLDPNQPVVSECQSVGEWLSRSRTKTHSPRRGGEATSNQSPLSSKRGPHFKTHKKSGKNKNKAMDPDGTRNQDWRDRG
jgi:hypothetical protein